MKKLSRLFLLLFIFSLVASVNSTILAQESKDDELVLVIAVTRHGDRTPFEQIKNSPVDWGMAASELTPIGMQQEFQLGQSLRERYVQKLGFLSEKYVPNSMFVLSSNTNRTIMSAECLLYGLYPLGTGPVLKNDVPALPSAFQPIPIRTVPEDSDAIMIPYPKMLEVMKENVNNQKYWIEKADQYKADMARWSNILGNRITSLSDVMTVGDVMIVRNKHGIALPTGMTQEDAEKLIGLSEWALAKEFSSSKVAYLCGGRLFNIITGEINKKTQGKNSYKFMLYSGHDISIMPLMTLLGSPLEVPPGYAAHMEFELYRKSDGKYFIKVRYDNNYVSVPMMNGGHELSTEKLNALAEQYQKEFAK